MTKIKDKWRDPDYLERVADSIRAIAAGRPIISNADLSGIIIGPFAMVNELKAANLFASTIVTSDLSYSKISGGANDSAFTDTDFRHAHLDGVLLRNAAISACNFSSSKLLLNMDDATCKNSQFVKARFVAGSSGMEYGGRRVTFITCDFTGAVFDRVEFRASTFINCNFTDAQFKQCDFRGVTLEGGTLPLATQFEKMDIPNMAVTLSQPGTPALP